MALGNLAKLVLWSILSFKNWKVNAYFSQSSLATGFFEGKRENILHIFQSAVAPKFFLWLRLCCLHFNEGINIFFWITKPSLVEIFAIYFLILSTLCLWNNWAGFGEFQIGNWKHNGTVVLCHKLCHSTVQELLAVWTGLFFQKMHRLN